MLGFGRHYNYTLVSSLIASSLLSGCFQNLSSTSSLYKSSKAPQSNFTDNGGSGSNGFDGTTLNASTLSGGLIGSYASPTAPGTLGLMVNLRLPLANAVGDTVLTDLLNRVDAEVSVQNIRVVLQIPQFGIKVSFPFSKVAFRNSKALRNVLSIRPGLTGVDVATGYAPDQAPLVQQSNGYIFSYGGLVDGSATARLSVFYRSDLTAGATGFLPNTTNSSWGVGFPDNGDPQNGAIFMRLTQNLGKIFYRLYADPATNTWSGDPDFSDVQTNYSKFLLGIHVDSTVTRNVGTGNAGESDQHWFYRSITKAWIVNPLVAAPKGVLLCSSSENDSYSVVEDPGNAGHRFEVGSKRACNCDPISPQTIGDVPSSQLFEPCGAPTQISATGKTADKLSFLVSAIMNTDTVTANSNPPTPRTGTFPASTVISNGFTLSPL
ncbi:MAG: hypothetical protein H7301_05390 [Cryobacterium sp.]|nr:hypothetical protein [Oligoflexia bacterium]